MTGPAPGRANGGEARAARGLLTIDEAAAYLHAPFRWVADAVRQQKGRCTRIGKYVRFRLEHLDELVAACEQPGTTAPRNPALTLQAGRRGDRARL